MLVFAAFDDITTDDAPAFTFEYAFLVGCAAWLLFVGLRLLRDRHHVLGGVSLLALVSALWARRAIGPGITPGLLPEYVVITATYLWFCALSLLMIWMGWREYHERDPRAA
jgi:hypothetical protein